LHSGHITGEAVSEGFGHQRILGGEVRVKSAVGQSSLFCNVGHADAIDPTLPEKPARSLQQSASILGRFFFGNTHFLTPERNMHFLVALTIKMF
jgi:hypothetical protein